MFLDTNIVVGLLNQRSPLLRQRYDDIRLAGNALLLSVVAVFELRFGAARSVRVERNHRVLDEFLGNGIQVIAFDAADAHEAGDIRAHLAGKGTPIGPYDILIAAQARRRGTALVTDNCREFERVPGLIVTHWAA
jgi:tRNA(fMet)-specific endonuclease VapC